MYNRQWSRIKVRSKSHLFTPQTNRCRVHLEPYWDHLFRWFRSTPEFDYYVPTCPNKLHQGRKQTRVGFNQTLQLIKESNHGLHFSVDVEVCSFIGIEVAVKVKGYIQQPLSAAVSRFLQEKLAFKSQFLNSYWTRSGMIEYLRGAGTFKVSRNLLCSGACLPSSSWLVTVLVTSWIWQVRFICNT